MKYTKPERPSVKRVYTFKLNTLSYALLEVLSGTFTEEKEPCGWGIRLGLTRGLNKKKREKIRERVSPRTYYENTEFN